MTNNQLKKQVDNVSKNPGIYLFKNLNNKPLYIGKALNLKSRLKNYLKTKDARLDKMISGAHRLDFIETDSDIEALILESQLIKKFRPSFNIMLRDDKQYSFVVFSSEKYQKIFTTHQPQSHEETIGPFTDAGALKTTLRLFRRIFPYCTCKQLHNNFCLNYHIEKCLGFCCLKKPELSIKYQVSRDYKKNIIAIKNILSGKKNNLMKNLEKEMTQSAKKGDLEKAIELKEKLGKLKRVFENVQVIHNTKYGILNTENGKRSQNVLKTLIRLLKLVRVPTRIEGYDVSNIQGIHATGSMVTFVHGQAGSEFSGNRSTTSSHPENLLPAQPDKNFYRKFKINSKTTPDDTAMLQEILERRFRHEEWPFPDLILIDGGKGQVNMAIKTLKKMMIKIPVIGISKNERHVGHQLIIPGRKNPIALTKLSPADKNLLLQIDSEAHRLAISYYRKLHRRDLKIS